MNIPEDIVEKAAQKLWALIPQCAVCKFDETDGCETCKEEAASLARAALSAAAPYLMSREVVTTVAELESLELPDGSVLIDARGNPWKLVWDDEVVDYWITTGSEWGHANTDMPLPATILYTPKEAL